MVSSGDFKPNPIGFSSIRIKIILLPIIGILGMLAIAGINKYLDHTVSKQMEAGRLSQCMAAKITEMMMLEEKFINTKNDSLLEDREALRGELKKNLEKLKKLTDASFVEAISQNESQYTRIFHTLAGYLTTVNDAAQALTQATERINTMLDQITGAIDQEEMELMLEGEMINRLKISARKETLNYASLGNRRQLNIFQNLFILSDREKYLHGKKELDQLIQLSRNNVSTVYTTVNEQAFFDGWKKAQTEAEKIVEYENVLFTAWEKNQELLPGFNDSVTAVQQSVLDGVEKTRRIIKEKGQAGDMISLVVAAVSIIVLIALGVVINQGVAIPISKAVDMLKNIAEGEGDLTKRLDVHSKDEVGEMANWFNQFVEKIQLIVGDLAQNSTKLNTSATALAGISQEMAEGADQTASKASGVVSSSEGMSRNFNAVAGTMEETATNMNLVSSATDQMSGTIHEISQNTEKANAMTLSAVKQAQVASKQMDLLGGSAQEIGKVIGTITEIGEQVNLLALNATIEAARAGDAGKGFAVVANEIKELARQTTESSSEIKHQVEGIQHITEETVNEIGRITTEVNDINEIVSTIAVAVEEQTATTREISQTLSQADTGINEVNDNVAQSSRVAENIVDEISDVTHAAEGMKNSSNQIDTRTSELLSLAETLNAVVGKFKY